jgi:UDP-N-acetyl-D-glucosamine dehydrogenase
MDAQTATARTGPAATLKGRLLAREARVAVYGAGYVGLPHAVELARAGFGVTAIERLPQRVEAVLGGRSYIDDVPDEALSREVAAGRLSATTDPAALAETDSVTICVPTPLDEHHQPDISYLVTTAEHVSRHLHRGMLVILESTTYPGTTEEVLLPILRHSGLEVGRDFFLAFSPERLDPGNRDYGIADIPRVVGGVTPACADLAAVLYGTFVRSVHRVSSPRVAELCKLLENIFRIVNVSMVNEMALLAKRMGIDIWEVIEAARTKPYGFMPFYPGPGVGGHCIPIDPFYLSWKAREYGIGTRFIELAGEINAQMPHHVVDLVADVLNQRGAPLKGSKVLVLGVAFKRDVGDWRESPALTVMKLLRERQALVSYHDPFIPEVPLGPTAHAGGARPTEASVPLTDEVLQGADVVIVATDHTRVDYARVARLARAIVDTRNAIKDRSLPHVTRL